MIKQTSQVPANLICNSVSLSWFMFHILILSVILFYLYINRVPALVTAALLISGERMSDTIDSSFFYGKQQVTT